MTVTANLPQPPARQPEDGRFPFGLPNSPRPARWDGEGAARQLVLGVYPSALHVGWRAPRSSSGAPVRIAAMAVDVEPCVFWDGRDAEEQVSDWTRRVGFDEGDGPDHHGHVRAALNGPSGATLGDYFSGPILPAHDTVFADVYPVFMVKTAGPGSTRKQQGDAIQERFNPAAAHLPATALGPVGPAHLRYRLSPGELPAAAVERFGPWLLDLLRAVRPERVVTLGQEPWTTLSLLPGLDLEHPSPNLSATRLDGYGREGTLRLDGRDIAWTPLAHPGLLNSSAGRGGTPTWREVHSTWAGRAAKPDEHGPSARTGGSH
jgi:hypothetical protein